MSKSIEALKEIFRDEKRLDELEYTIFTFLEYETISSDPNSLVYHVLYLNEDGQVISTVLTNNEFFDPQSDLVVLATNREWNPLDFMEHTEDFVEWITSDIEDVYGKEQAERFYDYLLQRYENEGDTLEEIIDNLFKYVIDEAQSFFRDDEEKLFDKIAEDILCNIDSSVYIRKEVEEIIERLKEKLLQQN
ncbi:hypothetical protein HPJ92_12485 [Anoxybacillus flavithermus]|uniref:hypothetical protein n=1 Tax=Anoxybacillus flavithermus TaxID=33934 RepID=UPI0018671761|nr:hypothetical protein [Anoxybacillus flavithermus]MBE2933235.1 hypothetical protein [Anoxybacillus flavithermus]